MLPKKSEARKQTVQRQQQLTLERTRTFSITAKPNVINEKIGPPKVEDELYGPFFLILLRKLISLTKISASVFHFFFLIMNMFFSSFFQGFV